MATNIYLSAMRAWLVAALCLVMTSGASNFTYDAKNFYLDGEQFIMIGGEMDPQRVPSEFWRDRLIKAKAMGLNTIFIYTFWNMLEPHPGQWASHLQANNIAKFSTLAQEEGLKIVLRPGLYVCGERDWGGYPAWLSQVPDLVVRDNNKPFLDASRQYIKNLADDLKHLQVTEGGPILMVQVENEYGSFGDNMDYKIAMRDIVKEYFDIPLYTTDGGAAWFLQGGYIPGVLAEADGRPADAFRARDATIKDKSCLGPLVVGEFYVVKSDSWGPDRPHHTSENDIALQKQYIYDVGYILSQNNSFSFYMWHGGTNFGFSNGALWENRTRPWTTSYDHGSPLDESGRTNELYFKMRDEIAKYVPENSIPEPPQNLPLLSIPEFDLLPSSYALDTASSDRTFDISPITMDALGQAYGFILYEHTVANYASGVLQAGDKPRDRILIFVNGKKQGIIDSFYATPATVELNLKPNDQLQLLVENGGRFNYWNRHSGTENVLRDAIKGIKGDVKVGESRLIGWFSHPLPFETLPRHSKHVPRSIQAKSPPVFYSGKFWINGSESDDAAIRDTFVNVPDGVRGFIWVNGFNLGRYWVVGPQQSLYLPGSVTKSGAWNEFTVLELEPHSDKLSIRGDTERVWANKPDPDAPAP